ncbi:hypothetical protein ABB26_10090 [Stenotrophomonas humi]|uniref:Uncharacterized protein n=1 Tax=Stenotrophomonas humi TaxID=405444 RepID=A0A0R0C1X4_9GAMM|nr:hypothetical protein [Stenotrophomonas humi]KRG63919.1 hypothetical protein ABB26_10090 [Stenotrophomonas humi]
MSPDEIEFRFAELERRVASLTSQRMQVEMPALDPLTIMAMARERVVAHGGGFLETVRDLIEAYEELRIALSRPGA